MVLESSIFFKIKLKKDAVFFRNIHKKDVFISKRYSMKEKRDEYNFDA